MNDKLRQLYLAMWKWDEGDAQLIQHFAKVHSFARLIGTCESLDEQTLFLLETEALIHDIGILPARKAFGSGSGKFQEQVSDPLVRGMLGGLGFDPAIIDRAAFVISHHHTYTGIDGIDYQILVEADFLVNLYEEAEPKEAIEAASWNQYSRLCGTIQLYYSAYRSAKGRPCSEGTVKNTRRMETACEARLELRRLFHQLFNILSHIMVHRI